MSSVNDEVDVIEDGLDDVVVMDSDNELGDDLESDANRSEADALSVEQESQTESIQQEDLTDNSSESSDSIDSDELSVEQQDVPAIKMESTIKSVIEAAIFASAEPVPLKRLMELFPENACPEKAIIKENIAELQTDYEGRGVELVEVASGYRFQARSKYATWLQRLWQQRPPRYTRALLETLALVAYKQPLTRGEIEDVRGVAVSSNIVRTLLDRGWVKVVGHRDVPGKPALLATTKDFLDYFGLHKLSDLPPLSDIMDLDALGEKLGIKLNIPEENKETEASLSNSELVENEESQQAAVDQDANNESEDAQVDEHKDDIVVEISSEEVDDAPIDDASAEEVQVSELDSLVEDTLDDGVAQSEEVQSQDAGVIPINAVVDELNLNEEELSKEIAEEVA